MGFYSKSCTAILFNIIYRANACSFIKEIVVNLKVSLEIGFILCRYLLAGKETEPVYVRIAQEFTKLNVAQTSDDMYRVFQYIIHTK